LKKQILSYLSLGQICDVQSGGTPSRHINAYWEKGNIPWVKISDIKGKHLLGTDEYITRQGLENSSAKIFPKGTILYTIFATLGETTILNIDAATNQAIAGINIHDQYKKIILTDYLYYYLLSIKDIMCKVGRGVAQNNLNLKILRNVQVPVPTIEEQKKIIDTLSSIEKIMLVKDRQLSLLSNLVKSRFIEMFGDPIINSLKLPCKTLSTLCDLKAGIFTSASEIHEFQSAENPYPCYGGNGIRGFVDNYTQEGKFPIIGRQGALCGNVQLASGKFRNTEHAVIVKPKVNLNVIWLYEALILENLNRLHTGAAQPGLAVNTLNQINIPVPSIIEQDKYEHLFIQLDKSKYGGPIFLRLLEDIRICCNI
jgi:type I restriction enzyme S subunit